MGSRLVLLSIVRLYVGVLINNLLHENASKRIFILKAKEWDNDEPDLTRIVIICILHEI